jgi:DNA-binding transcriptional LysR family regulator
MSEDLILKLQLKHFRLIHAINITGQLGLAAERLSMTQPAASRMLSEIEHFIGQSIFSRSPRGMSATPIGVVLARHAEDLLGSLDEAVREIQAFQSAKAGVARIGAVTGGAMGLIVPAVREFKQNNPEVDIHIHVAPSDQLITGLMDGEYDFVLSRIPPGIDPRLFTVLPGRVETMRFMVRQGHPLTEHKNLGLNELVDYEWVIQAPGTPLRAAVEEAFTTQSVPLPHKIVNTTSLLVMIAYLASTDAIAPISHEVTELLGSRQVDAKLAVLDIYNEVIVTPYHLITRKNRLISPLAQHLRELVFSKLSRTGRSGR